MIPLLLLLACGTPEEAADPHAGHVMAAGEATTGHSLHHLDLDFTDQRGEQFRLEDVSGHPTLISMVYTSCTAVCPMIVGQVQTAEHRLSEAARGDLRVVLVSLDPERDDTAALAALASRHGVDPDRWRVVRADEGAVRALAAALGVKYRRLADGEYSHSAVVALLDGSGAVVERIEGVASPTDALVTRAESLASP